MREPRTTTPSSSDGASHELIDHTSEVTIRVRAPTFPGLVAEATHAFGELVPEELRGAVDERERDFTIRGLDRVAALVGWLNETAYLCEADQWLPTDLSVTEGGHGELLVRARGRGLRAPFVLVKAATLHGAFVRPSDGGVEAEVTLDV